MPTRLLMKSAVTGITRRSWGVGFFINETFHKRALAQLRHEGGGTIQRVDGPFGIDPPLEAVGRVGLDPHAAGGLSDGRRVEAGGLEEDLSGRIRYFGILAAHDAGDADGFFAVADHQGFGRERVFLVIQGHERLAVFRHPGHKPVACHPVVVVGVEGLAGLEHHEVCDVDDVVDGAKPGCGKSRLQPFGGRADGDIEDEPCGKAAAGICGFDGNGGEVFQLAEGVDACRESGFGLLEGFFAQEGDFPCKARHACAIDPVGGEADLEDGVVKTEGCGKAGADLGVLRKIENARRVPVDGKLGGAAEHPFGDLAADLAFFELGAIGHHGAGRRQRGPHVLVDVGRAADDTQGLGRADVDLAEPELVGPRMGGDVEDPADRDGVEVFEGFFHPFHFKACHGEGVIEFRDGHVHVDERLKPVETEFHD